MNIVGRVPELASGRGRARGDGFNAERAEKDSNAESAELAGRLPGNFLASLARSAFQIVSAACCRNRSRHRGAEVAEDGFERRARRARRASSWKLLGVLGALGVSDRLGGLLSEPFAAPRSGGRRGRFRTPSAPSSPSVFLETSRGPWRARRFRSSRRPLFGAIRGTAERRSPRRVSNAERAEIAERLPGNFSASFARLAFESSPGPPLDVAASPARSALNRPLVGFRATPEAVDLAPCLLQSTRATGHTTGMRAEPIRVHFAAPVLFHSCRSIIAWRTAWPEESMSQPSGWCWSPAFRWGSAGTPTPRRSPSTVPKRGSSSILRFPTPGSSLFCRQAGR